MIKEIKGKTCSRFSNFQTSFFQLIEDMYNKKTFKKIKVPDWFSWGVELIITPRLELASAYPESCKEASDKLRGDGVAESKLCVDEPRRP